MGKKKVDTSGWVRAPGKSDIPTIDLDEFGENKPLTVKDVMEVASDLVNLDVSKLPPEKRADIKEAATKAGFSLARAAGEKVIDIIYDLPPEKREAVLKKWRDKGCPSK